MRVLLRRAWAAIKTPPRAEDYAHLCFSLAIFAALAWLISGATGFLRVAPREGSEILLLAARAFFVPALGEELVFRAALVPSRSETPKRLWLIALSTALFIAWHAVETLFLPNAAATFLRVDFLALAALLGLFCALLRWRSGSIWTAVLLHWLVVFAWQGWFGGPSFGAAR